MPGIHEDEMDGNTTVSLTPKSFVNKHASTLAFLSLLGVLWFAVSAIIIHLIRSDLDFNKVALSIYAVGKGGYILESGFYSIGLSQILIGLILFSQINVNKFAALSIILAGLGAIAVGIFPTHIEPVDLVTRLPHIGGAALQFLLFPVAILFLSKNLAAGKFRRYTFFSGIFIGVLFFLVLALFIVSQSVEINIFGLIEKLNIAAIDIWLLLASWKLSRCEQLQRMFSPQL